MAENNTVPLGQAGTGSAFVLGENQALDRYLRNEDYNAQVARQSALLAQRAKAEADQQKLADYTKNALNVKAGLVFRDVDDQAKAVIEKGKELYQRGINPWQPYTGNDPNVRSEVEDLQRQRLMTEANAERREALQPLLLKEMTSYDPSKHTRSSFDRLNKYTRLPASEAFTQAPPTLQPKLQPNLVLDKVKLGKVGTDLVVGNRRIKKEGLDYNTARGAIVDQFKNEAALDDFLQEDLGITGYTVDSLEKLPKTFEGIKELSMKEYRGNPEFRTQLAFQLGIVSPEQFEKVATEKAIEAYDAKQKYENFMDRATKSKLVELGSSYSNTPDTTAEDQAIKRRNQDLKEQEANGSGSTAEEPIDIELPYNKGKAKTIAEGYVPLSVSKKNFAGIEAIDLKTGKPVPALRSSNDYEIVGLGNFPIIKAGNYAGSVSQPEYASGRGKDNVVKKPFIQVQQTVEGVTRDFLVPYSKLPENVKNSKSVREALANFKPAKTETQSTKSDMVTVTVNGKSGQIPKSNLADFKKKYPNAKVN